MVFRTRNPFNYGRIAVGENFVDREEELARLRGVLRLGESAVVYSPDGLGKSSLVAELARRASRDFDFVYLNLVGVADEAGLLNVFARDTMGAVFGGVESFPPAAWGLITNPSIRRTILDGAELGPNKMLGLVRPHFQPRKNGQTELHRQTSAIVRMCPECGKPLKWMEKYHRHYCYNCKKYTPIQKILKSTPMTMLRLDELMCPQCSGQLKYVHKYAEHYCEKCGRYPLLEVRRASIRPSIEDVIDALDLPERIANLKAGRVVMILDEFQAPSSALAPTILKTLGQRCAMHGNVSYIFAGNDLSVMSNVFQSKSSPLCDFAEWIELGPLPYEVLERFLMDRFHTAKGKLSQEAANLIAGASGGIHSTLRG